MQAITDCIILIRCGYFCHTKYKKLGFSLVVVMSILVQYEKKCTNYLKKRVINGNFIFYQGFWDQTR